MISTIIGIPAGYEQPPRGAQPDTTATQTPPALIRWLWIGFAALLISCAIVAATPKEAQALDANSAVGAVVPWKIYDGTLVINCKSQTPCLWKGEWNTQAVFERYFPAAPWKGYEYKKVVFETLTRPMYMSYLFYESQATDFDFTNLDTSKVTKMESMFDYCRSVVQLDLRSFNITSTAKINGMFTNATSLQNIFCNDTWPITAPEIFAGCNALWSRNTDKILGNEFSGGGALRAYMANPVTGYFTTLPWELSPPIKLSIQGSAGETLYDVGKYFDFECTSSIPEACTFEVISLNNDTGVAKIGAFAKGCYDWPTEDLEITVTVKQKEPLKTRSCDDDLNHPYVDDTNYMAAWTANYDKSVYYLKVKLNRWHFTSAKAYSDAACTQPISSMPFTNTYEQPSDGTFQMVGTKSLKSGTPEDGQWTYRIEPASAVKMMAADHQNGVWSATNVGKDIQFPPIVLTRGGTFSWVVTEESGPDAANEDRRSWLVVAEVGAVRREQSFAYEVLSARYFRDDISTCTAKTEQCQFTYEDTKLVLTQSLAKDAKGYATWASAQNGQSVYFSLEARQPDLVGQKVIVTLPQGLTFPEGQTPTDTTYDAESSQLTWTVPEGRKLDWTMEVTLPKGRDVVTTKAALEDNSASVELETILSSSVKQATSGTPAPYSETLRTLTDGGAQPTETLRAGDRSVYSGNQWNYQASSSPLSGGGSDAVASYLTKAVQWESRDEGRARIDLEGATMEEPVNNATVPVYIFTVCSGHNFKDTIAKGNIEHLVSLYGVVAVKAVDSVGNVTADKLYYSVDNDGDSATPNKTNTGEIQAMLTALNFVQNVHYSNCVAAALRTHIFGSIATPLDEAAIVHDPVAIYISFDNIGMTSAYPSLKEVAKTHLDLWPICGQEWFDFVYDHYVRGQNRYFSMSQSSGAGYAATNIRQLYRCHMRDYATAIKARSALGLAGLMSPEFFAKVGEHKADYSYEDSFVGIFNTRVKLDVTITDTLSDAMNVGTVTATYKGSNVASSGITVSGKTVKVRVSNYDFANPKPVIVHINATVNREQVGAQGGWFDTNTASATLRSANTVVESVATPILALGPPTNDVAFTPVIFKQVVDEDGVVRSDWPFDRRSFTFTMKPLNEAPAPNAEAATTNRDGEAKWSELTFSDPGHYAYTVTESPGEDDDIRYDTATHALAVDVSEEMALTVTWDGKPVAIDETGRPVANREDGTDGMPLVTNVKLDPIVLPEAGGTPTKTATVAGVLTVAAAAGGWWLVRRRRRR